MQIIRGIKTRKGVTCHHLGYVEKLRLGRDLEAELGFRSGGTEERISNTD